MKVDIDGAPVPVAFFAVVSIGVIGLYVAFAIPIYLRWKAGDNFTPGGWTLGAKYKWMCIVALVEIVVTSIVALLPTSSRRHAVERRLRLEVRQLHDPRGARRADRCSGSTGTLSVKNWFTGPKHTIEAESLNLLAHAEVNPEVHLKK